MDFNVILWIVIMVVLLMIEGATMNLTTIWMAIGALAAFFFTLAGAGGVMQFAVFVIVSTIMVIFTRPIVKKHLAVKYQKTNTESLIGRTARVVETIDNSLETGTAFLDGKEWSARTESEGTVLEKGDLAVVTDIVGVKLIVSKEPGTRIVAE